MSVETFLPGFEPRRPQSARAVAPVAPVAAPVRAPAEKSAAVARYESSFRLFADRARAIREAGGIANLRRFFAAEKSAHAGLELASSPCEMGGTYVFPKNRPERAQRPARGVSTVRVAEVHEDTREGCMVRPGSFAFAEPRPGELDAERASKNLQQRRRWAWWLEGVENYATAPQRPADDLAEMRQRSLAMRAHDMKLARRMADAGAAMFPENRLAIGIFDPIADTVEMLPSLRRLNFLQSVASQRRADQLIHAEYYLGNVPADRIELHTFTAGRRVLTDLLRPKLGALSRKLGEMVRQRWYKRCAEMVWRGEEIGGLVFNPWSARDYNKRHGIPEQIKATGLDGAVRWVRNPAAYQGGFKDEATGARERVDVNPEAWLIREDRPGREPLWHVHAHCLVVFHAGVTAEQKADFWQRCREFWGHVCDRGERENGETHVENLREAIKYPAKPADLDLLNGGQLIAVCEAVSRLKIILPRAGLRRFRADCRRSVEKPARRFGSDGRSVLRLGPDHNSKRSPVVFITAPGWRSPSGRLKTGFWGDSVTGLPVERKAKNWDRPAPAPVEGEDPRAFLVRAVGLQPVPAVGLTGQLAAKLASMPVPDRSTDTAKATDTEPAKPVFNRILAKFLGPDARPRFVVFNPIDRAQLAGRAQVSRTVRAFTRARDAHAPAPRAPRARLKGVHNRHSTCTPLGLAAVPGVARDPKTPPDPAERLKNWAEITA